jgi:hypothetical protein
MKTKGRPPLEPRIAALEAEVKALQDRLAQFDQRVASAAPIVLGVPEGYKPSFDRWPGVER